MKKPKTQTLLALFILSVNWFAASANGSDSAYIFAYSKEMKRSGLNLAWSIDKKDWHSIGSPYRFLFCDYGNWSTEKTMYSPYLFLDENQIWHCVWSVNDRDGVFAHAASRDLVNWVPQSYPVVMPDNNCTEPEVSFDN